ncbi:hypothetical protein JCM3774_004159 [Rhodotorula dairenensis]
MPPVKPEDLEEGELPLDAMAAAMPDATRDAQRDRPRRNQTQQRSDLSRLFLPDFAFGHRTVGFKPYPSPSLSPLPVHRPQNVAPRDYDSQDDSSTRIPQTGPTDSYGAFSPRTTDAESFYLWRPWRDLRNSEFFNPPNGASPSHISRFAPPAAPPTFPPARGDDRSAQPVGWAPPPPPRGAAKRARLVHPSRKHVHWPQEVSIVVGRGAGHVAAEDLYTADEHFLVESDMGRQPRIATGAAPLSVATAAASVSATLPKPQEEDLMSVGPQSTQETEEDPAPKPAGTSAVPASWTAWYDCLA